MIPKSVSVSTRIVALVAVLTWPVWAWAGEPKAGDTIVFLPGNYDKDHPPQLAPKDMQCLVRMREAMLSMKEYMNEARIPGPESPDRKEFFAIRKRWEATMKDCVDGGK